MAVGQYSTLLKLIIWFYLLAYSPDFYQDLLFCIKYPKIDFTTANLASFTYTAIWELTQNSIILLLIYSIQEVPLQKEKSPVKQFFVNIFQFLQLLRKHFSATLVSFLAFLAFQQYIIIKYYLTLSPIVLIYIKGIALLREILVALLIFLLFVEIPTKQSGLKKCLFGFWLANLANLIVILCAKYLPAVWNKYFLLISTGPVSSLAFMATVFTAAIFTLWVRDIIDLMKIKGIPFDPNRSGLLLKATPNSWIFILSLYFRVEGSCCVYFHQKHARYGFKRNPLNPDESFFCKKDQVLNVQILRQNYKFIPFLNPTQENLDKAYRQVLKWNPTPEIIERGVRFRHLVFNCLHTSNTLIKIITEQDIHKIIKDWYKNNEKKRG